MPELPEVETVRRGIERHGIGRIVVAIRVSGARMRLGSRASDLSPLTGQPLTAVLRRAKFLLLEFGKEHTLLIHLGMTGTLRMAEQAAPPRKHDHLRLEFSSGDALIFNDARRFGLYELWRSDAVAGSPHLRLLGVEPLARAFNGAFLHALARGRATPLKPFLMDAKNVVGVGNIYASEACHRAGLNPRRRAGALSRARAELLAGAIKRVLRAAIKAGGTTLRDFTAPDGAQGYFRIRLAVYDRAGEPCRECATPIRRIVQAGRATFFCPVCQRG